MKAYYEAECRSDAVIQKNLMITWVPYSDAEIVICTGDRVETHVLAVRAFLDHKYIIHYYAGVKNKYLTTYDDYLRHCITILSNEQWVESKKCKKVVKKLLKSIGRKPNIKVVGSNHLLNTTLDRSLVPDDPYNLVLYNPCTKIKEIFIGPNPDISYASVPQEQLLGLIENCEKFYTNSSSGVYEAPFLIKNKQIVWLGKRNKKRCSK
jgi:UDP-N-acetylglucosamine 2-epimerase